MITNFYLTFNYSVFYKISFAKLAYFHSASWPSFVRQVGRNQTMVSDFQLVQYKRHHCTEKHIARFLSTPF